MGANFAIFTTNENKKHSRTAVFSLNGAPKMLIEHTPHHFQKGTPSSQESPVRDFVGGSQLGSFGEREFENRRNMNIKWTLLHFLTIQMSTKLAQLEIVTCEKYLKNQCQWRP